MARRRACVAWTLAWLVVACPASAAAATWQVTADEPGRSLQNALRQAADGDAIELAAGDYHGQVGVVLQKRLTLRGVGGRPVLHADGRSAEGKAILVVRDGDVRVENIEFRGSRVPDGNGAGIRFERGRLEVVRCAFFDNQMGILTSNNADAELLVSNSEFGLAPTNPASLPHLVYVGRIAKFTLSGSSVSGGRDGHLVKSRARVNHIVQNQLVDGETGSASYELEFPNGGLAYVTGNVIGQSRHTGNPVMVSFGAEGAADARAHGLFMTDNTLINAGPRPAVFVRVVDIGRPVPTRFVNNKTSGPGSGL